MAEGLLYVVYNEWIREPKTNITPYKIGITTTTVEKRYYGLGLKMPGDFKAKFAYKLTDCEAAERFLHGMLDSSCVKGEWFNITQKTLDSIQDYCKSLNGELITNEIEGEIGEEVEMRSRRSNNSFKTLGIKPNTKLILKTDLNIICTTTDEKNIVKDKNGKELTISALASRELGRAANGFLEFMLEDGTTLDEMRGE
jgi:hypothetical protein